MTPCPLRHCRPLSALAALALVFCGAVLADEAAPPAGFRIEVAPVALKEVPVASVRIEAVDAQGELLASYEGSPRIEGVRLIERGDPSAQPLPAFEKGALLLRTDLSRGEKVYLTADAVTVEDGTARAAASVHLLPRWVSLVPPVVAILLAMLLRNVLVALFLAIWSGAALLAAGEGWLTRISVGFVDALDSVIIAQLADRDHLMVVLFTLFLGCMVGVMSGSGGSAALVNRLSGVAGSRRRVQLTTCGLGLVVFFDDYANTLLLGSTMRPVTDRLRIAREKLAFLVDATAAPVAGLAIVSTWIGIEVGLIDQTFAQLSRTYGALTWEYDAYATFLDTLPYRFYPLLLLVFVAAIAWTGRDFGPMRAAELRAANASDNRNPAERTEERTEKKNPASRNRVSAVPVPESSLWNAVVPLIVLFAVLAAGFWWTGRRSIVAENMLRAEAGEPLLPLSLRQVISHADSYRVLLVSSFLASTAAVCTAMTTRALSLQGAMEAWLEGARQMLLGVAVLVLAWGVSAVCDSGALNTAGALVEMSEDALSVRWMPALAFLLSAAVAFATGTSWATMSLLIPLVMSLTAGLLIQDGSLISGAAVNLHHPILLAAIGAVLAGSIFGDHCSPISDTTVLSSVACDCDHIAHVWTQLPYAITVGLIALATGYVPVGFGWPVWMLLPAGIVLVLLVPRLIGRRLE